jgi:hypothetical protein
MYHGLPPPPAPLLAPPSIPPISTLVKSIIDSPDKLFLVYHLLGNPTVQEWSLVCIAFEDITALSLSCLQDSHFLVKFYTLHNNDARFNAPNQRYWLQYYSISNLPPQRQRLQCT